ncbi:MAG: thiamine phosphate synthase [Magnetovibrio sp.]|nr:thiamine phosphate synthase [Magnetovibrio sp.]|tara:strand:+ start:29 stop:631 length:603 start_codon:yes stop_codon:yes gene_type:complete
MQNLTDHITLRKLPKRILLTDSMRLADPRDAIRALPAESGVILRHYNVPDRAGLAREILTICRPKKIPLLIAGDAYLARTIGADGLHLPEDMLAHKLGHWRRWLRPNTFLCVAAHSPKALCKAASASASFALLSPVFKTKSHPESTFIGIHRFTNWTTNAQIPVYALGGVNYQNEGRVLTSGAVGWAAIDALSNKNNVLR